MTEHGRCHSFQSHACDERATTPDREHGGVRHTVVGSTYTPVPIGHDAKARIGPVLATSQGVSVQPMACPGRASTIQRHQSDPPSKVRIVFTTGAIAIAIAVLIAVILILAAMKSDDFQVERSLVVGAICTSVVRSRAGWCPEEIRLAFILSVERVDELAAILGCVAEPKPGACTIFRCPTRTGRWFASAGQIDCVRKGGRRDAAQARAISFPR